MTYGGTADSLDRLTSGSVILAAVLRGSYPLPTARFTAALRGDHSRVRSDLFVVETGTETFRTSAEICEVMRVVSVGRKSWMNTKCVIY